jgi:hypothetical protein
MKIKTINELNSSIVEDSEQNFNHQKHLTGILDEFSNSYNQNVLNEIVLWKVNRYVEFSEESIILINKVDKKSRVIDKDLTSKILVALLKTKGIRLPMASTILRFKNPNIYQIIDQRVYRIIYGEHYNSNFMKENENSIKKQIDLYLEYLKTLKIKCNQINIDFKDADRILYEADKILNKNIKIKY